MASITFFISLILATLTSNVVYGADDVPMPDIDLEEWWGPGNGSSHQDTSIREFKIRFDEWMIKDLIYRLKNHRRFTKVLRGIAFQYGFNSDALNYWVKYLCEEYPFKQREQFLNKYPHYTTVIQGLTMHFMRVRSKNIENKKVVPLLILHGWPGSIREFYETIPHLLSIGESKGLALEIIAPSLPGLGFSDGADRPGMGTDKMAVVCRNLMHRLGHEEYYVQGGDTGSLVGGNMATFFSNEVKGFHTNLPFVYTAETPYQLWLGSFEPEKFVKPELVSRIFPLWTLVSHFLQGLGYLHIQATKPDSIGFALADSPAGLMAYMLEKISGGLRGIFITYPDGGLTQLLTAEQIIDNFMIYWTTNSMTTAMRYYSETFNKRYFGLKIESIVSPVPTWVLQAPNEMMYLPPSIIKKKFPCLLHETLPSVGGHFYAWERPEDYAVDVVNALVAFGEWHERNGTMSATISN